MMAGKVAGRVAGKESIMDGMRVGLLVFPLLFMLVGLSIWRKHLRESKLLRFREMLHAERMKALENGLPLPEVDDAGLNHLLETPLNTAVAGSGATPAGIFWVRLISLCLGLTCLFGGLGLVISFWRFQPLAPSALLMGHGSLGLIPVCLGIGLLLFYHLSRGLADTGGSTSCCPPGQGKQHE